ncbi:hypothetical protein Ddye_011484 [Dipteronia dyeriana]|uniref:Reverse transcriptase domain-containing protein n=1 Tax=Dipteronia dyeriana TaxID=168575 RepID=A0AAE0CI79_9ROSI|nr:hypothetical protein Ddye_011484 [Dipteronia dyeriana]
MGFGVRWVQWIADCVMSPTLSVLVNGSPTEQFGLERGLRQGDPLSLFLFNIVSEALKAILLKASEINLLKGVNFGSEGVNITHLQFVDDMIVFLKPSLSYLKYLKRILRCFEIVSGLRINFHKSCIARVGKKVVLRLSGVKPLGVEKQPCRSPIWVCLLAPILDLKASGIRWFRKLSKALPPRI